MGKSIRPCPVMMWAGSDGAVPLAGGAHKSLGLVSAANRATEDSRTPKINLRSSVFIFELPCNQVTQLTGRERRSIHTADKSPIPRDNSRLGSVRDKPLFGPIIHPETPRHDFDLPIGPG